MAKLLERVKLSDSQRAAQWAGKAIEGCLTGSTDAADFARRVAFLRTFADILLQQGEGKGRRFSGSRSHDFIDQASALQSRVKAGNVPTYDAAPVAENA